MTYLSLFKYKFFFLKKREENCHRPVVSQNGSDLFWMLEFGDLSEALCQRSSTLFHFMPHKNSYIHIMMVPLLEQHEWGAIKRFFYRLEWLLGL